MEMDAGHVIFGDCVVGTGVGSNGVVDDAQPATRMENEHEIATASWGKTFANNLTSYDDTTDGDEEPRATAAQFGGRAASRTSESLQRPKSDLKRSKAAPTAFEHA
jgi:hypothetical protein